MAKILCFGAGYYGKVFLNDYYHNGKEFFDEIVAFIDNNKKRCGTEFEGYNVISPSEIGNVEYDYIIVTAVTYETEIRKQLNALGIRDNIIFSFTDYLDYCFTRKEFYSKYPMNVMDIKHENSFSDNLVVYTAITGDYDELRDPLFVDDGMDYVCFTNNKKIKSNVWNIEIVEDDSLDNIHLARHIKIVADNYLSGYETSVWVDGKFQVMSDLRKYINEYGRRAPMICFPHFERKCIYDEAAKCITVNKGIKKDIIAQISDYYHDGYPMDNGLFESGCIVRNHNDPFVKKLMQQWWEHVEKYSYRDQLSFPYLLWKNQFYVDICDLNINKNPYLYCVKGH